MAHKFLAAALTLLLANSYFVSGQSNYASQANNVEYQGEGLPEQATLDGKVTKLDDLSPVIFLNRTKAALNCAAGSMQVELKFNDKFYGIAYADFDRNSGCHVAGKGDYSYKLQFSLQGCGTKQGPPRVFTNNIVVRFHPGLEMDGDEVITIVCRYPPPIAPLPAVLPASIREDAVPAAIIVAPLTGYQILLIICAILFLSLMLLGLGCSYYCLRKRSLTVIRKQPFSTIGDGSEITKLSGSSLGNLSMFEGLKIPRAHAPVAAMGSSSGSEGPLISDTLPSDYPSESHSEIEDVETRSLPVSSAGSFENKAYVQDNSSFYSEGYGHTQEIQSAVATAAVVSRLPMAIKEQPKFDVQVKVKRAPPAPPSPNISDSESSIARTERNLSTILEQREDSVRTMDSPPPHHKMQFSYVPELHPPPKYIQPAPVYHRILRRQQELQENQGWDEMDTTRSMTSLNTEMTDTHSMTEMIDDTHNKFVAPVPPPPPPIIPTQRYVASHAVEIAESLQEPPIAVYRKPEITSHVVDDVFLRTITEKRTIEDIERHKRLITEYHTRPKPIEDQQWDVTIRNYPADLPEPPEWENFSDISSASGLTLTPKLERASMSLPPQSFVDDNKAPLFAPELVGLIGSPPRPTYTASKEIPPRENYLSTFEIPIENPSVPNWDVLIRVFKPTEEEEAHSFETTEVLTMSDKIKWRQIITTESTLRTMLTEAVIREDYERIRHDQRYEPIFEPPKWDIIIRILAPVERPKTSSRFRKKSDWDTRSRRSSLPIVYEYDSDGASSVRTLTNDPIVHPQPPTRSRKTSRSSYRSDADFRSMSEVTVDFARPETIDSQSETSTTYYPGAGRYYDDPEEYKFGRTPSQRSLTRSLSQPSLARSASEFTERWVAPSRYDTGSEFTSPDTTPKSQRSTKIQPLHVARGGNRLGGQEHNSVWQASSSRVAQMPGMTSQMMTQRYVSETSTSFRTKDWFADNDSEASFK